MSGRLTTHILDTALGRPAAGIPVTLWRLDSADTRVCLASALTNDDGRLDTPLVAGDAFTAGIYELLFDVDAYLRATQGKPGFYDQITIRFSVTAPGGHHHVPLLLAPHGYSTYRGS